jgi:hypothetical protein
VPGRSLDYCQSEPRHYPEHRHESPLNPIAVILHCQNCKNSGIGVER